jgi:Reverse transcriptase (RNA-dependent DNA polymerase)
MNDNDDDEDDTANTRSLMTINTYGRYSKVFSVSAHHTDRCDLDSHADTCVGGANSILLEPSGNVATVHSFSDERKPFGAIPIGTIATSWTDSADGITYVLCFPESLYFGDRLSTTLLCPNQLRDGGTIVEDTPRQFNPKSNHCIRIGSLTIPLMMDGVISYFESRKPTDEELKHNQRFTLTSNSVWDPHSKSFARQELALEPQYQVASLRSSLPYPELYSDDDLYDRFISCVRSENSRTTLFGDDDRYIESMSTKGGRSILTPEILARRWNIGLKTAQNTIQVTSQRGLRSFVNPIDRRLPTSQPHLSYSVLNKKMYSDTMFSKANSLRSISAAQVWTDGQGFCLFYPISSKAQAYTTIHLMIHDLNAIPRTVFTDGALEETEGNWKKEMQHFRIKSQWSEPYSQWQNKAESEIRELKRMIRRTMQREHAPRRLWDYCGIWCAAIRRRTALSMPDLQGRTPEENIHARMVDISAYSQFDWYSHVWFIDYPKDAATSRRQLGRWLGVAEHVGSPLCYIILPKSCKPIIRSSVQPVTDDERLQPEIKLLIEKFDAAVERKIGNSRTDAEVSEDLPNIPLEPTDVQVEDVILDAESDPIGSAPEVDLAEADDWTPESYDTYISAKVMLPKGDTSWQARVLGRAKDDNGNPIGKRHQNPILDTREYEVQLPDGSIDILSANAIAEAMYSQVDEQGHHHLLIKEISDHRKDGSAVATDDGYYPGTQQKRWTTKGWFLLVEWKDGGSNWVPLKDLKESNPIEVAEYAVANKLVHEPVFAWWVPHFIRQRDRNVLKMKSRKYILRTHKFGIEVPKTTKRALEIDKETKTDFWRKAIEKEMKNNASAFELLELLTNGGKIPVGYQLIKCHMIFDIKMDFTRKARFVAGGHLTDPPKESVYSSVVTRESVRLFFLIAALNDLDVLSCDIQNAYLNAGTKERNYFFCGLEFGAQHEGKPVLIVKALYGLRSSGAQWRDHMANTLKIAGFKSCKADADVWIRPAVKDDGTKYYEYVLCYVDDILCGSMHPQKVMDYLSTVYTLKAGSVQEPQIYLGADVKKVSIGIDRSAWGISSDSYVASAVREVERKLKEVGKKLPTGKCTNPMSSGYRPELDASPELKPEQANYFQSLIGALRWAVELGRIDIIVEVNMLSRYLVSPRVGHLEQALHIFTYLKRKGSCTMVFDPTEPVINESEFVQRDWSSFYPDAAESIPPNMPEPRGKEVITRCFVDADHAGCLATRRSTTGCIIYVNEAPIVWYSKRQNTVESSTFGSEYIALRQAIDLIEALRYKLRMMGVPLDDSTAIYCDNEAVVKSTTAPESTLKKKHNAICYHRAREAQAAGYVRLGKILGTDNRADSFTKVLIGEHRAHLLRMIFRHPPGTGDFGPPEPDPEPG